MGNISERTADDGSTVFDVTCRTCGTTVEMDLVTVDDQCEECQSKRRTLALAIDVSALTETQINTLMGALQAQCEAYDDTYATADGEFLSYPDVQDGLQMVVVPYLVGDLEGTLNVGSGL